MDSYFWQVKACWGELFSSKIWITCKFLIVKVPFLATGWRPSIFFIMLKLLLVLEVNSAHLDGKIHNLSLFVCQFICLFLPKHELVQHHKCIYQVMFHIYNLLLHTRNDITIYIEIPYARSLCCILSKNAVFMLHSAEKTNILQPVCKSKWFIWNMTWYSVYIVSKQ